MGEDDEEEEVNFDFVFVAVSVVTGAVAAAVMCRRRPPGAVREERAGDGKRAEDGGA